MLNIQKKEDCSGCTACVQVCPKHCITFDADMEGFFYPRVNHDSCIQCGLCERVCPIISHKQYNPVLDTYAMYSMNDELRNMSSSGGLFGMLAQATIDEGGIVIGVKMSDDCREAIFSIADNQADIIPLLGSKYLQAYPVYLFKIIEEYLKQGRSVLFSGTPCQVNGLKHFLNKDYESLMTIDLICHGVPSPSLWKKYIDYSEQEAEEKLSTVNFRCKQHGWKDYGMEKKTVAGKRTFTYASKDAYMQFFTKNYSLRPACYQCMSKTMRLADMTLGDFWGVNNVLPDFNDQKGVSAVIIRTEKGKEFIRRINNGLLKQELPYSDIVVHNRMEYTSVKRPKERSTFYEDMQSMSFAKLENKYLRQSPYKKGKTKIKRFIKRFRKSHR